MFQSITSFYPVRVVFKKDVSLPQLGISYQADTSAEIPLFLALKLDEMNAVEIDDSYVISPKDIANIKYAEQRESYPAKLPEDFYPRLKLSVYLLNKKGDSKTVRMLFQETRELLIERVKKIALLVATRSDIVNDQSFLERLALEEKALLASMYNTITSFMMSIL
ncbi:MAG: GINS complex subunit Sld5 [Pyrobaculum sp.]|uniref:GINS complex subunit Sld5 n=1 Tax=Pyrobaculum sp. TaxID=2004705 RepID=UPI003EEDF98A